ncbi:MAG: O-antigen ligase family protein, partial [Burkholderiaceae bacterium]|nr:O-antigen ligase family protein [Burkholderiaceae bacterium]
RALKVIVASSVPVTIYTLVGIARGDAYMVLDGLEGTSSRYRGPFPHPNILAFYVVLVMGVLLYQWKTLRTKTSGWTAALIMGYLLVLLLLLFATKTRSAWVSAAFLFFVYGLLVERRFLLYLALVPAFVMFVPEVRDRILDLGQGNQVVQNAKLNSFAWRKLIWSDGLAWMSPSRYLVGYGSGSFLFYSPTFFTASFGRPFGAHSVPVQQIFELGIGGLITFLLMFWKSTAMLRRMWQIDRLMVVIFGGVVWSYLLISFSDNMLAYLSFNWYFWLAVGAVCSMAALGLSQKGSPASAAEPPQRFRSRYSPGRSK